MHMVLSCIAMGVLQGLSINLTGRVKTNRLRYQRTPSREAFIHLHYPLNQSIGFVSANRRSENVIAGQSDIHLKLSCHVEVCAQIFRIQNKSMMRSEILFHLRSVRLVLIVLPYIVRPRRINAS